MHRSLLLIFFLWSALSAQQMSRLDSLKQQLAEAENAQRAGVLVELVTELHRKQPEQAIDYGRQALTLLRRQSEPELEVEAWYQKGRAHYYLNQFDSVLVHAGRVLEIADAIGNQRAQANAYNLMGVVYGMMDDRSTEIELFQKALALRKEVGDESGYANTLNNIAIVYEETGEYDKALEFHRKALAARLELGDKGYIADSYNNIGVVYWYLGRYDDALQYYQRALALREEIADKKATAETLNNIGVLYTDLGEYEDALKFYNRALAVREAIDDRLGMSSTLLNIGSIYAKMDSSKSTQRKALQFMERALMLKQEFGERMTIAETLNGIGAVHTKLGNYALALNYLQRSLLLNAEIENPAGVAAVHYDMSRVYNLQGELALALEHAQEGVALAETLRTRPLIRDGYELLSQLYAAQGQYERAFTAYKNFKAANDSIFNANSQSVLARLQTQYKTKEQEQRIELLEREREIRSLWLGGLIGGLFLLLIILVLVYNRFRLKQRAHEAQEKLRLAELEQERLRTEAAEARANYLQAENDRKTHELETARTLQLSMLPVRLPDHPRVEIAAFMQTATEVGGDYYDFKVADDGSLTIVIGDATGHGAQAGTMVTATKSLFNILADSADLLEIVQQSTVAIKRMNMPNLYMAAAFLRLRGTTLELVGAGMPPALIYRAAGDTIEAVELKGMPLGSAIDFPYTQNQVKLGAGDTVLLMSDGLPELFGQNGEMLGYERMPQLLAEVGKDKPDKIIGHFKQTAARWLNGAEQKDDMTFVVFKVKDG